MARTKEFDVSLVLDKAMQTFWEKGYEKTSMQDLVDRMGIHRRSIYDTFGDKHALFLRSLDRYEFELEQKITSSLNQAMTIKEQLETLFSITLSKDNTYPKGCLIVNTATELSLLDEEVSRKVQTLFSKNEEFLHQLLVEAQKKSEISMDRNLNDLAGYLHNAWIGLRVLVKTTNDQEKLTAIMKLSLSVI